VSLGSVSEGEAQRELRHVLADVERGRWSPPAPILPPPEPERVPTFHEFAEEWWKLSAAQLAASTLADYRWRLERHLLPFFADCPLDGITFDLVGRYMAAKLAEPRPLSARSINMTLTLMAAILDDAVERELIARNPAKGRRRRVREREPHRTYLETAEQIAALLAAAGDLDANAREDRRHVERRAIIATLTLAGLRIGEMCALRWRDVDLANGWLQVGESKTDAGRRRVKLRGALRDELVGVRMRTRHSAPDAFVFATRTGARPTRENVRNRVLAAAAKKGSERLVAAGYAPLPERLTPHSLRRTFASVLYALGEDPGVVMDEMGHTDPALALRVYRQTMRRGDEEKTRLRELVEGKPPTGLVERQEAAEIL
jgi:integrase